MTETPAPDAPADEPAPERGASSDRRAEEDDGAALLARYLAGDERAFNALVQRYRAPLYGYFVRCGVHPPAADELFQETFLRVHQSGARYRPDRPFHVWLFTIAANLMRSHWRRARVRRVMVGWWQRPAGDGEARPLDPPDGAPLPEAEAAARQSLRWLEAALDQLPGKLREALVLTRIQGLPVADAAAIMRVPESTIKTWVRRGRIALAEARAAAEGPPTTHGGAR